MEITLLVKTNYIVVNNFRKKIIEPHVYVVGSFSWLKNILEIIDERYSLDFLIAIWALTVSFQNIIQTLPSVYLT